MSIIGEAAGLNFAHAAFAARAGGRAARWLQAIAIFHPGACAAACWAGWWALRAWSRVLGAPGPVDHQLHVRCEQLGVGFVRSCLPAESGVTLPVHSTYNPAAPSGTAALAASWLYLGAVVCTIGAVTLFVLGALSSPTHRLVGGRLQPTRGHTSLGARRRGAYTRIKAGHAGVMADWRAAKRDRAQLQRGLRRAGTWRLRRWGRRWAIEDHYGAERSRPGLVDRLLIRHADPPKDSRKARRRQRKADRKAEQDRLAAEYEAELADIARHREEAEAGPRLDPTGGHQPRPGAPPPPAPGAGVSPEHEAAVAWAAEVAARAQRDVWEATGYRGYTPPPAPGPAPAEQHRARTQQATTRQRTQRRTAASGRRPAIRNGRAVLDVGEVRPSANGSNGKEASP